MKTKLIKFEEGYTLNDVEGNPIGQTFGRFKGRKLSFKNCEAIANGYDLDELSENHAEEVYVRNENDYNELANFENRKSNFEEGFKKALEILGDKKFSEEDIDEAFDAGHEMIDSPKNYNDSLKEFKESLQQTEWDVEVEMRSKNIDELRESNKGFLNNSNLYIPKLDADGCLILKRI